jgi:energy-coupling factor transporter ATP-binding protein EcfA2
MSDVASAIEAFDLTIGRAVDLVPQNDLAAVAAIANRARGRRGFLGETLVLALAGGTGSGKSSLLNAIAGRSIAATGVIRPTTDRALAWLPARPEKGLTELLDRLDIDDRIEHESFPRLALIDLPDHDSIVVQHHLIVERLLPEVDGIVWVFDPQKYRDPLIHETYITRLIDYQDQFVFVLNQIDRVGPRELTRLKADLAESLAADGVEDPQVFGVAAAPPTGAPVNVAEFRRYLGEALDAKNVAAGKLLGDIRRGTRLLLRGAGLDQVPAVEFDTRWPEVRAATVQALVSGSGFEDAICHLGDFITALSVETGPAFGDKVRTRFSPEWLEGALIDAIGDAGGPPPRARQRGRVGRALHGFWSGDQSKAADVAAGPLTAALDARVGLQLREVLWRRGLLGATVALTEIETRRAQQALG